MKMHLARLVELEYVVAHRAAHGAFDYELVYETSEADNAVRCPGLIDVAALHAYDTKRSGQTDARSGSGRPLVGARSVGGRDEALAQDADGTSVSEELAHSERKTHVLKPNGKAQSYPQPIVA